MAGYTSNDISFLFNCPICGKNEYIRPPEVGCKCTEKEKLAHSMNEVYRVELLPLSYRGD